VGYLVITDEKDNNQYLLHPAIVTNPLAFVEKPLAFVEKPLAFVTKPSLDNLFTDRITIPSWVLHNT